MEASFADKRHVISGGTKWKNGETFLTDKSHVSALSISSSEHLPHVIYSLGCEEKIIGKEKKIDNMTERKEKDNFYYLFA